MRRAIISFTVLTSDAGVCFHGKKGFTGVGFDTLVARAEARGGRMWKEKGVRDEG